MYLGYSVTSAFPHLSCFDYFHYSVNEFVMILVCIELFLVFQAHIIVLLWLWGLFGFLSKDKAICDELIKEGHKSRICV